MLLRTDQGVRIAKDWDSGRIGRAYTERQTKIGEGMDKIQSLLLPGLPKARLEPRPVPVTDNVEALARFLRS